MTASVLLVDDQPLVRVGFRMVVESQDDLTVVGEAGDGAEALRLTVGLDPDVVLMDLRMPGMDGIEATRRIVAAGCRSRVLILATFDLDEFALVALRAGASGCLLKDVPPGDLLTGIRAVAGGDAVVAPGVTRRLLHGIARRLSVESDARLAELTITEREVFIELARGLSNAEIANDLGLSEATVKRDVGQILAKLGLRDRGQVIVFACEIGFGESSQI